MDVNPSVAEPEDYEPRIKSLKVEDGKVEIQTDAPPDIIKFFYASFKELLDKHDAPNFVQMEVKPADEVDRYMVTVQKVGGKTPIDKMNELRAIAQALYEGAGDFCGDWSQGPPDSLRAAMDAYQEAS